jgi:predicted phage terminase large subunit-like protein
MTDLYATAEAAARAARGSFVAYRRLVRPTMLWGWEVEQISLELQLFYQALVAGERPMLAIVTPPQHGKSWAVEDLIAWTAGKNPDHKTIYASYSEDLGTLRNHNLRRTFESPVYGGIFPDTRIGTRGWQTNASQIEYVGHTGSFRNTTVGGPITGLELHIGVVDDPVKGRAEAQSKIVRDRTWAWFVDDFRTRFAAASGLLMIGTRWHIDDPIGRLIDREPRLRLLTYPAIAEADDGFRRKGEALFPALKPLDFLLERKSLMSEPSWQSVYQGHPYLVGGGMFPVELFRTIRVFDRHEIKASVLAVDKAGTAGGDGAYTAIVLMHKMKNGQFVIERVARGHWSALEREVIIKRCIEHDYRNMGRDRKVYQIVIEQEPGSGGKESAEATIRNLAGYNVIAYKPTGDKAVRAEPLAAQVQGGNVLLHAGSWHEDFLEEAESWPNSPQLDQIDAAAMAFNHLTLRDTYDQSYAGFRD